MAVQGRRVRRDTPPAQGDSRVVSQLLLLTRQGIPVKSSQSSVRYSGTSSSGVAAPRVHACIPAARAQLLPTCHATSNPRGLLRTLQHQHQQLLHSAVSGCEVHAGAAESGGWRRTAVGTAMTQSLDHFGSHVQPMADGIDAVVINAAALRWHGASSKQLQEPGCCRSRAVDALSACCDGPATRRRGVTLS